MKGIEYIRERQGAGCAGRMIPVLNRVNSAEPESSRAGLFGECGPMAVINECPVPSSGGFDSVLTEDVSFLSGVSSLCGHLTNDPAAASHLGGGESIAS
jgi:hypothetical protein